MRASFSDATDRIPVRDATMREIEVYPGSNQSGRSRSRTAGERGVDHAAVAHGDDGAPGCAPTRSSTASDRFANARAPRRRTLPIALDHRGPALVLARAELFHRDVVVGLHVVLDQAVHDLDPRGRAHRRDGSAVSRGWSCGLETIASTRSCVSHDARRWACSTPAAVNGGLAGTPVPDSTRRARRA